MVSARSVSCLRTTIGQGPQRWPLSEVGLQSQMSPAVERGEEGRGGRQIKSGENEGKEGGRQGRGRERGKKRGKGGKQVIIWHLPGSWCPDSELNTSVQSH